MPSNFERKARKSKRQTRLVFEPASSSPATKATGLSPAKIRYEALGRRRQAPVVVDDVSEDELALTTTLEGLPMPMKSSQNGKGSEDIKDNFEDPESQSDGSHNTVGRTSTTPPRRTTRSFERHHQGFDGAVDSTSSATPSKKMSLAKPARKSSSNSPSTRKRKNQKHISISDDDTEELAPYVRKTKPRTNIFSGRVLQSNKPAEDEASSSEKSEEDFLPTQRTRSKLSKQKTASTGRRARPIVVEEDDEHEDAYINSSVVHRERLACKDSDEDSDDQPIASPLKRRRTKNIQDEESSDSLSIASPLKRRKQAEESEEGSSDDEDLPSPRKLTRRRDRDSSSATPVRYTRQQREKRRHRTEREKALELAKRRRAGDKRELTPSGSSSSESEDSNLTHLSEFEDDDEEEVPVVPKPKAKSRSKFIRQSSNEPADAELDDEEDDFIVEDDEDQPLGVDVSIPLAFTASFHQKPKEHFKYAIEWMVHKKLDPGFYSKDEIYRRAFQVLDNKPMTLAQSKYGSSVWTPEFYRALDARPIFHERKCGSEEAFLVLGQHKCQACNRTNHPSTYAIRFEGKAYHKDTLDEVEQDDGEVSEEGDSDSSKSSVDSRTSTERHAKAKGKEPARKRAASVDEQGISIPPEDREWYAGQFCFRKAQTAHMLIHWKYELYQWVLGSLESQGELSAKKLVKRDKMNAKERREYANKVVDRWATKGGEINSLWRDYETQIRTAEEAPTGGRWGR